VSVSSQIYPWQRFWYERGAVLNLVDGGYLPDPQSEQERLLNPSVISFTANEKQHCLVLLGEPGMGKSIAARQEARSIEDGQGVKSAWFDLRGYSTEGRVVEKVLKGPEVTAWSRNDSQLHLFLDSFDECWPKVTNLPRVLCEELKAMPLERLYLRIICRTALWPSSFEQLLAEVLGESGVTVLELAPLRKCDVQTAATANGLDTEDFLSEIERRRVVPLAGRPVTLNFLLGVYAKDRKLPDNQWDLYERGCLSLCDEPDTERREAPMPIETSARQRLNIASWVATLTVLCARSGIRPAASAAETGEESCLSLDNLRPVSGLALDGLSALTNIGLRETLNTGLFAAQGPSILGWSHQTFAEFLCARFLHDIGAPVRQLRPIFENHGRIVPQLRGVASWLSACDDDLRDYLLREDPETLLLSDALFTTDLAKSGLVDALLAKSGLGDRLATDLDSFGYYGKLDNKHLAAQLRPYVSSKNKAPSQRDLAIEIAHACRAGELLSDLANVALDVSEDLRLRASAAMAISRYGDPAAKRRLRPLALGEAGDDPNDDLRGYGLACVWPEHMTADELFASLKEPEDVSYFGGYEMFLAYDLPAKLRPADLPAALAWLNGRERHQYYSDPFDRVASQIMWLAWTEYDSQGVAGPFAMAVLRRLEAYADVMGRGRRDDFVQQLGVNSDRRRRLALQLMRHLAGRTDRSSYLLFWRSQILKRPDDFGWVLRLYGETLGDAALKAVLLDVIPAMIDSNDRSQVDAVFGAAQNDGSLREAFAWLFGPIPLDSSAASSLRERWKREQRAAQESPAPVVKRRGPTASELLEWIVRFDAGDTSAWWKLNLWMMVDADGQVSDDSERVWDITRLPGWALLDEAARTKVTETARTYLERASPEISRWLHRNVFFRPAAAGYRALVLLRNRAPAVYSALTREVWLTWTPAVLALAAPWVAGDEALLKTMVLALGRHMLAIMPAGSRLSLKTYRLHPGVAGMPASAGLSIGEDIAGGTSARVVLADEIGPGADVELARAIIRAHSGRCENVSSTTQGTFWEVTFPGVAEEQPAPAVAGAAASPGARVEPAVARPAAPQASAAKILLADDEENFRMFTAWALRERGYEVVTAKDGQEAFERFQEAPESFALVILDAYMPRMGGLEAYLRMQILRPDLPVLFASGFVRGPSVEALVSGCPGPATVLLKPFSSEDLLVAVAKALAPR